MANGKKSFLLYCDLIHTVKKLPKEKQAELFIHILEYVNDLNPETDDLLLNIAFEPIKQGLKRDLKKYEKVVERNKINGSLGGRPPKPKKPTGLIKNPKNPSEPKKPDSDSDSDSDNVKDKENKNTPTAFSFFNSLVKNGASKQFANEWIKVRKTKRLTNTETALKKFLNQVEKSGYQINEVLEKCIEKSWGGFDSEWYNKQSQNGIGKTNQKLMTYDDD
jgi:hypothetical protein